MKDMNSNDQSNQLQQQKLDNNLKHLRRIFLQFEKKFLTWSEQQDQTENIDFTIQFLKKELETCAILKTKLLQQLCIDKKNENAIGDFIFQVIEIRRRLFSKLALLDDALLADGGDKLLQEDQVTLLEVHSKQLSRLCETQKNYNRQQKKEQPINSSLVMFQIHNCVDQEQSPLKKLLNFNEVLKQFKDLCQHKKQQIDEHLLHQPNNYELKKLAKKFDLLLNIMDSQFHLQKIRIMQQEMREQLMKTNPSSEDKYLLCRSIQSLQRSAEKLQNCMSPLQKQLQDEQYQEQEESIEKFCVK